MKKLNSWFFILYLILWWPHSSSVNTKHNRQQAAKEDHELIMDIIDKSSKPNRKIWWLKIGVVSGAAALIALIVYRLKAGVDQNHPVYLRTRNGVGLLLSTKNDFRQGLENLTLPDDHLAFTKPVDLISNQRCITYENLEKLKAALASGQLIL